MAVDRDSIRSHPLRWAAVVLVGCVLNGCDDPPRPPLPFAASQPASAPILFQPINFMALKPTEATPARPAYAVGRILGPDGKPLDLKNGPVKVQRIEVRIRGVLNSNAQDADITFDAAPDGTYVRRIEPGSYNSPTARIEFAFEDHTYKLPLIPILGDPPLGGMQESTTGVVQDFAWRLTGVRPGAAKDEEKPDAWIGGSVYADYINWRAGGRVIRAAPLGTKVVFTITPKSPLADGTAGKPIVVERKYEALGSALGLPLIPDLPLARLEVRGLEIFPDGKRQPLMFLLKDQSWGEAVEGTFTPDLAKASLEPVRIKFTRKDD